MEVNEVFYCYKGFVFSLKEHLLEGYTFITTNYDTYLRTYYEDSIQLPSEDKRGVHHVDTPFTPCYYKDILHWRDNTIIC